MIKINEQSSLKGNSSQPLLHRGVYPCRKIVFDISSHDQGWGGDRIYRGSFQASWTWFDAYVVRPDKHEKKEDGEKASSNEDNGPRSLVPFLPDSNKLQCNRTATKYPTDYHIVWHYRDNILADSTEAETIENEQGRGRATLDGKSVREMQVGDQLVIWARARYAQWRNHVDSMSVRVFWAV